MKGGVMNENRDIRKWKRIHESILCMYYKLQGNINDFG